MQQGIDMNNEHVRRRVRIIFDHITDKNKKTHSVANLHYRNNVGISGGVNLNTTIDTRILKKSIIDGYFKLLRFYSDKYLPEGLKFQIFNVLMRKNVIRMQNFNIIETLIVITIIVAFSGLTSVVIARKFEETKQSRAILELGKFMEGLTLFYTRHQHYPLLLEELKDEGDITREPMDPWGNAYNYVPHLDWGRLNRLLTRSGSSNAQDLAYYIQAMKTIQDVLANNSTLEPAQVLAIANDQPFVFSSGNGRQLFPTNFTMSAPKEKQISVARQVKMAQEKSSSHPELHDLIGTFVQMLSTRAT